MDQQNNTTTTVTEEQYQAAREVAATYEREKAALAAAQRAAYAIPVKALVESPAYREVYEATADMLANHTDDSYFGIPVNALHTIAKNLAMQVGVDMDAPVVPTEGEPEA